MLKFKMEDERQLVFSSSEPEPWIDYSSDYPPSTAPVEQPWEQQEQSNKDEVTELAATIQELAISDEEGIDSHEQDDRDELPRTDEDSQCHGNVYGRPATVLDSDGDSDELDKADNDAGTIAENDELTEEESTTELHDNATQNNSNWEKVRQEVTCAICLELLDDPKSMPCLHTYCKKCLMEALAKRPHDPDLPRDRPAINCPLCRAEVTLPDKGIEGLPSNFSATRLVETVQLQDKFEQNKTQKCDSCIEGDAIASCCECGGFFLCITCLSVHKKLPSTKAHSMLSLNQLVQLDTPFAANKSLLCQRHPQEPLKLYCEDCEALVCRDCVLVRHKLHNYNFVDDIIDEEKDHLQDVTLEELQEILTSTKEAITGVEEMQAKVLSCNDQHVGQLNKTFEEIADMLNRRKRTFLVEVRQITEDDLCPLQKQQEDLVTLKEKIKSCHDFTQKMLNDGTSTEIMSAKKQMLERTKHLQKLHSSLSMAPVTEPSTTVFYQMDKIKEVVNSLGVVIDLQQSSIKDIPDKIYVDESVSIGVVLKNTKGQPIHDATKAITSEVIMTPALTDDDQVISIVLESGDGKYSVHFTPKRYRNHIVSIKVNGHHISDSPTELKLDVKPRKEVLPSVPSYHKAASITSNYLLPTTSGVEVDVRYDHHSRSRASLTSLRTPPFSKPNHQFRNLYS